MTPKERMINALNFNEPDDIVPFWEIEFHLYNELIGKEPIVGYEFEKLTEVEKEKAIHFNAELFIETAETMDYSAICGLPGYWEIAPGKPAYLWIRDEKWRIRLAGILKEMAGDKFFIIGLSDSTLGIPAGNRINEFVEIMFEQPDEIDRKAASLLKDGIEIGYKYAEAGADALLNASDIAFNSGCFYNPEQFERFIFPYLSKWASTFKSEGIYSIYHSDGNLDKLVDRLMDSGISALQCIDPIAGMDIVKLKKMVSGRITLIGNVNCSLLQLGSKQEIEEESKSVLEGCKSGGGFVFSSCNAVFKGIPIENYMVMAESRKKYGRYATGRNSI